MTIKLSEYSLADKVFKIIGKKRGVIIPSDEYGKFGPYSYFVAKKESFFKALFRPANKSLPNGMVDINDLNLNREDIVKTADSGQ